MYHLDDANIIYLKDNVYKNVAEEEYFSLNNIDGFIRHNESFHLGFSYLFNSSKFTLKHQFSAMMSNFYSIFDIKKQLQNVEYIFERVF